MACEASLRSLITYFKGGLWWVRSAGVSMGPGRRLGTALARSNPGVAIAPVVSLPARMFARGAYGIVTVGLKRRGAS